MSSPVSSFRGSTHSDSSWGRQRYIRRIMTNHSSTMLMLSGPRMLWTDGSWRGASRLSEWCSKKWKVRLSIASDTFLRIVYWFCPAYRLYTIIGRLLGLIDEITNWYIRFNRKRLKGENGKDDTKAALNTLFETLFTLTRTMVRALLCMWLIYLKTEIVIVHSFHD